MREAYLTEREWAQKQVAGFPHRWQRYLMSKWADMAKPLAVVDKRREVVGSYAGNAWLRNEVQRLAGGVLPLEATDSEVCDKAAQLAADCWALANVYKDAESLRAAMGRVCMGAGVSPPGEKIKDHPAIARMTDGRWWRRNLRRQHAKHVEAAAIELGFVNRARECYVSDETVIRRAQQNRRNAAAMERTIMQNEEGQEYTLAELAAKGTANKTIRRGELMTRIAGFEKIAHECGHAGLFLTVTCPSRMHKWATVSGSSKVYLNGKYDGTLPRDAQQYLTKTWKRIRAAYGRRGIGVYGFRIVEPNHDETPHWHMILFMEPDHMEDFISIVKRYALADSPDEAGAQAYRVKPVVIDWSRGSAAGYVAKYVAKNIDGMHVEKDLLGNDAMHTSARVEAWASAWGIRQFQQIGGAPVGVWREMRRIKEMPEGSPAELVKAHAAVNKHESEEGHEKKAADWAEYVKEQGGVFCGRDYKIRLAKEESDELGIYGEIKAARPVGVEFLGLLVRSARHIWQVVKGGVAAVFSPPWTRVNNCTPSHREEQIKHDEKMDFLDFLRGGGGELCGT